MTKQVNLGLNPDQKVKLKKIKKEKKKIMIIKIKITRTLKTLKMKNKKKAMMKRPRNNQIKLIIKWKLKITNIMNKNKQCIAAHLLILMLVQIYKFEIFDFLKILIILNLISSL